MSRHARWLLVVTLTALPAAVFAAIAFSAAGAAAAASSILSWTAILLRLSGARRVQRWVRRWDVGRELTAANLLVAGSSLLAPIAFTSGFGFFVSPSIPLGMLALGVVGGIDGAARFPLLYGAAMLAGAELALVVLLLAGALRTGRRFLPAATDRR
jgi:hypothetical protein